MSVFDKIKSDLIEYEVKTIMTIRQGIFDILKKNIETYGKPPYTRCQKVRDGDTGRTIRVMQLLVLRKSNLSIYDNFLKENFCIGIKDFGYLSVENLCSTRITESANEKLLTDMFNEAFGRILQFKTSKVIGSVNEENTEIFVKL